MPAGIITRYSHAVNLVMIKSIINNPRLEYRFLVKVFCYSLQIDKI